MLAAGLALAVFGLLPIATLPFSAGWRSLLALCWLARAGVELRCLARGFRRARAFRLDADLGLEVRSPAGDWRPAALIGGTVVLRNAVWLRYRDGEGRPQGELLTGQARSDANFRRLVVLLEHGPWAGKN